MSNNAAVHFLSQASKNLQDNRPKQETKRPNLCARYHYLWSPILKRSSTLLLNRFLDTQPRSRFQSSILTNSSSDNPLSWERILQWWKRSPENRWQIIGKLRFESTIHLIVSRMKFTIVKYCVKKGRSILYALRRHKSAVLHWTERRALPYPGD